MTRGRVLGVSLVLSLAALSVLPAARLGRHLETTSRLDAAESVRVDRMLVERFASPFAHNAVLVMEGLEDADSDSGRAIVRAITTRVAALSFVTRILSPANALDTLLIGRGGRGAIAVVGIDADSPAAATVARLRSLTAAMQPPGVRALQWTGMAALEVDLRSAGASEAHRSELRALPVSLVLAVWAFGGIAGALAGVAAGALTVLLALGGAALVAHFTPLTVLAPSVVSLLGLALGIDYALLILRRARETQADGRGVSTPAADAKGSVAFHPLPQTMAMRAATRTVLTAGAAAAAGIAPLALAPVSELRSAGLAGVCAVLAAVVVATTLGPVLARFAARRAAAPAAGAGWRAWGRGVVEHPVRALLAGGLPMLLLAASALRMRASVEGPETLPPSMESVQALRELCSMGRLEAALGLRLVLELPDNASVLTPEGFAALAHVEQALLADARIGAVRSVHTAAGGVGPDAVRRVFPEPVLRSLVSRDGHAALLEVAPAAGQSAAQLAALVHALRRDAASTAGVPGAHVLAGGAAAYSVDYADALKTHAAGVVTLALCLTFAVLFLTLRSLLLALKAVLLNLLSVGAALGLTTLVFQHGVGIQWLGLAAPLAGILPSVPMIAFCAIFGVGMDYEVFLLARVAEARRCGETGADAIVDGLARSAAVITRAAAIMTGVFLAFVASGFVSVKLVGFALAAAIALDATLVRLLVAPALLRLAWRWNWWPGEPVPKRTNSAAGGRQGPQG